MPFDQSTYETKPDVFSLEGLIAWLETQDPETEYPYANSCDCLYARFGRAHGASYFDVVSRLHRSGPTRWGDIAFFRPRTYGAALQRARELLK